MQEPPQFGAISNPSECHSLFAVWKWKPWKFRLMIGVMLIGYIFAPTPVIWGMYAYGYTRWNYHQWKWAMVAYDIAFFPSRWARSEFDCVGNFYQQQMIVMCAVFGSPIPSERHSRFIIPGGLF